MDDSFINIYQTRMDKCTREQFWAVALLSSMNGFVIIQKDVLISVLCPVHIVIGIIFATLICAAFIISRHFIYLHYDKLIKPIIGSKIKLKSITKNTAMLSGVFLYILISVMIAIVSIRVILYTTM